LFNMKMLLKVAAIGLGSTLFLASCSDGDDSNPPVKPPGPAALEDNFGPGFGALFRANANTDPVDPTTTTAIAVSVTADPVPVP
jgi:hypothetical protein